MNAQQLEKIAHGQGFIAALDQSGGSTPRAAVAWARRYPRSYSMVRPSASTSMSARLRAMGWGSYGKSFLVGGSGS